MSDKDTAEQLAETMIRVLRRDPNKKVSAVGDSEEGGDPLPPALINPLDGPNQMIVSGEDGALKKLIAGNIGDILTVLLDGSIDFAPPPGGTIIPYIFSSTTTDSDPGAGHLRLNSTPQNTSTIIRVDLIDDEGTDWTTALDTLAVTSGDIKGYIRLHKAADATRWIEFALTAVSSAVGYRNLDVTVIDFSAANPFANGDRLFLAFTRATGAAASGGGGQFGLQLLIGDNINVISSGVAGYIEASDDGTIVRVAGFASQSGSATIEFWKCTYAQFDAGVTHPVAADKISASAPLVLSGTVKAEDTALTGWTTNVTAGDIIAYVVTGTPVSITRLTVALTLVR